MNVRNISILGCGWLGLPLAIDLITKGVTVKGSTTTAHKIAELQAQNILPFMLKLGEASEATYTEFLADSEVVVINFPPKRVPNITTLYQQQLQDILPYILPTQKVLFISSTSVYQNTNNEVTETLEVQPEKESGKAVVAVEQLLQQQLGDRLTIIRLSGLIGYDRLPGRFLANKKAVQNGDAPINVIHRDDCIGLINAIIEQEIWGEIINGAADHHPLRKDFYTLAAKKIGLTPPTFSHHHKLAYKIVANTKSKSVLAYNYIHPDPLKLL